MIALAVVVAVARLAPAEAPGAHSGRGIELLVNRIRIDARSRLYWNGRWLRDEATLDRYLAIVPQLDPQPATVLMPDEKASPRLVTRVRAMMERRLHCSSTPACDTATQRRD